MEQTDASRKKNVFPFQENFHYCNRVVKISSHLTHLLGLKTDIGFDKSDDDLLIFEWNKDFNCLLFKEFFSLVYSTANT